MIIKAIVIGTTQSTAHYMGEVQYTFQKQKTMRPHRLNAKQKVTQYCMPDIGKDFNLRPFLWMRD